MTRARGQMLANAVAVGLMRLRLRLAVYGARPGAGRLAMMRGCGMGLLLLRRRGGSCCCCLVMLMQLRVLRAQVMSGRCSCRRVMQMWVQA